MVTDKKATSYFLLATMYKTGDGVPRDYEQAAAWYKRAADEGDPAAMRQVARLLIQGRGVRADLDQAHTLLQRAEKLGDSKAALLLKALKNDRFKIRSRQKEEKQANGALKIISTGMNGRKSAARPSRRNTELAALEADASSGNVQAMLALGDYYGLTDGVVDEQKAVYWYDRARGINNTEAKARLANLYATLANDMLGDVVDRFIRAASLGHTESLNWCNENYSCHPKMRLFMAARYLQGDGVRRNRHRALQLLKSCRDEGNVDATKMLDDLSSPEDMDFKDTE